MTADPHTPAADPAVTMDAPTAPDPRGTPMSAATATAPPAIKFEPHHAGVIIGLRDSVGFGPEQVAAATIKLAVTLGYEPDQADRALVERSQRDTRPWNIARIEQLEQVSDAVACWLTEHHAPLGYVFDLDSPGNLVLRPARRPTGQE